MKRWILFFGLLLAVNAHAARIDITDKRASSEYESVPEIFADIDSMTQELYEELAEKQDQSAALDAYSGVPPSAAVLTLLGAADNQAILTLLSLYDSATVDSLIAAATAFDTDQDGNLADETWFPAGGLDWTVDQGENQIADSNIPDTVARSADLAIDASGFDGNLSTTDDTVQELAQAVDDLTTGSGSSDPDDLDGDNTDDGLIDEVIISGDLVRNSELATATVSHASTADSATTADYTNPGKVNNVPGFDLLYTADGTVVFGRGRLGPLTATKNIVDRYSGESPEVGQMWQISQILTGQTITTATGTITADIWDWVPVDAPSGGGVSIDDTAPSTTTVYSSAYLEQYISDILTSGTPILTLMSPASSGIWVDSTSYQFVGTVASTQTVIGVTANINEGGAVSATGTNSWTYDATLSEGANTAEFVATANGQTDTETVVVNVDTQTPTFTADADSTHDGSTPVTAGGTVSIGGSTTTVTATVSGATPTSPTVACDGSGDCTTELLTPNGAGDVTATFAASDAVGHTATGPDLVQTITGPGVDYVADLISYWAFTGSSLSDVHGSFDITTNTGVLDSSGITFTSDYAQRTEDFIDETGPITVMCRFRQNTTSSSGRVVVLKSSDTGFMISFAAASGINVIAGNGSSMDGAMWGSSTDTTQSQSFAISDTDYHVLIVVFSAGTAKTVTRFYVDGVDVSGTASGVDFGSGDAAQSLLTLGSRWSSGAPALQWDNGTIGELAIWDVELDASACADISGGNYAYTGW